MLGAIAAGRRTDSALPGFLAAHGFDAAVYSTKPWPSTLKLPEVTSVTELIGPDSGQPTLQLRSPDQPNGLRRHLRTVDPPHAVQARLRAPARPVGTRPGARVVHPSTRLRGAPGHSDRRTVLLAQPSCGVQRCHGCTTGTQRPGGRFSCSRVRGDGVRVPLWDNSFLRSLHHARLRAHLAATDGLWLRVRRPTSPWRSRLAPVQLPGKRTGRRGEQ